jgi:hypothetical protein
VRSLRAKNQADVMGAPELQRLLPLLKRLGLWTYPEQTRKPIVPEPRVKPVVEDQVDQPEDEAA